MGKKYFYVLFIFAISVSLQGCGTIQLSEKEVKIELGNEAPEDISEYVEISSRYKEKFEKAAILDLSDVDVSTVGVYQAIVVYKEQSLSVPVIVEDTTPPIINPVNTVFNEGDQVWDFELVDTEDKSRVTLCMKVDDKVKDSVVLYPGITLVLEAADDYGNVTSTEIIPNVIKKGEKSPTNGIRIIDWNKYPPEKISFINQEAYYILKDAYSNVEWESKFEMGDLNVYDYYKEKFRELLVNSRSYYDEEEKRELFLKDYYLDSVFEDQDLQTVDFYFFDMDEDGTPELGITTVHFILIIKYDAENDQFNLWKKYETTYYEVHGSKAVRYDGIGLASHLTYVFYKLDENGNEAYWVAFRVQVYYDEEIDDFKEVYLMRLPQYDDKDKQLELSDDIKKQGYYYEDDYYFRVTKEQYEELTNDYFEAVNASDEEIKKVTYTYEEMVN